MIDFHCHLDLYKNALDILPEVAARNIFVLVVTTSPRAWQATSKIFAGYQNIKVALGLHPEIIEKKKTEFDLLISLISKAEFIGEIGIDGSRKYFSTFELQKSLLKEIFQECQRQGGRVLSLHSRSAVSQILDLIEKYPDAGIPVLHWFTGTPTELKRAIDLGCWFSVGPSMISTAKGKNLVSLMPRDRILPETDGPFATLDKKTLYPWDVEILFDHVEQIWQCKGDFVYATMKSNLEAILKLASNSIDNPC